MATKKAATKVAEVKEVKEVKVEAPKAEVKVEAPKAEVKAEVKKETAKKAPAKKDAEATKKAPAKKATVKNETVITVQFQGSEVEISTVEEKVKAQFESEGNKVSSIKSLNIYVKPEERSAYYVINGDITGRVDLF